MNKKHLIIFLAVLVFGLFSQAEITQAKWKNWTKVFNDRVEKVQAKEARFNALAVTRPNVYANYIRTSVLGNSTNSLGQKVLKTCGEDCSKMSLAQINDALRASFNACWPNCTGKIQSTILASGHYLESLLKLPGWSDGSKLCLGWGCFIKKDNKPGGSGTGTGIVIPPGYIPLPSRAPSPTPGIATITSFQITNFKLQQAQNGVEYYQVLKEQMAVAHPDYQLNLRWTVSGATACTASCKYVKIDDYLANQNFDQLQAQTWPCNQNIDGQPTFQGSVDKQVGTAKTKPKEIGIIRYTLTCDGAVSDATAHLLVVIQDFNWFETIPILNLQG
ncbi:MAG: hypothetical protein UW21_C0004G0015 [Candidatus Woesebacteria bacterium GW2011_GWB1_44_11b]|uniref:Uncharacterized protein n=1 Tax=Candidatus Woesebacteria bacterium GW2011_GWB1_44_11b TaxID=1618580 RepID=A0A0G1GHV5_9BACT|nr:MAG: hypothetical protein UW21_C0004G0015 [Candidatus Woesebacteria bacterium GW2011_GWB1_44_11b]